MTDDTELDKLLHELYDHGTYYDVDLDTHKENPRDLYIAEAKQAILDKYIAKADVVAAIGNPYPKPPLGDFWNVGRNQLRAQLRKELNLPEGGK